MTNPRCRFTLSLALLSSLLVLSCGTEGLDLNRTDAASDAALDSAFGQFCNFQGTKVAMGESFQVDCNTCTCSQSGVACTLMACLSGGTTGSTGGAAGSGGAGGGGVGGKGGNVGKGGSVASGGASTTSDAASPGCLEGDHLYAVGETFKRDCNTCTCAAGGASCTKMACPKPVDAGPDLSPAPDGVQTCSYGGRTYAIGEGFMLDCNTCNCTSHGMACTGSMCFHDAGPDSSSLVDASSCALSANLTFGHDGGMAIYRDVNRLTATTFTITRDYSLRSGRPDGGTVATCSPVLPACGSTGAVTTATVNADLANPDVQALWGLPQDPVPLFGSDPRPVDGTVYSIALDDGRKVLVGGQCASPAMSSCRFIPAGLVQLVQDLQKLASAMLADPACKSLQ